MHRLSGALLLASGLIAGAAGGYWLSRSPLSASMPATTAPSDASAAERHVLYYRDASGGPYWSKQPRKDANGRNYVPVYADEELVFGPGGELKKSAPPSAGPRKILFYRNPMGLSDTSPIPKKDWMGMDYIAVYEGEEQDDGKTVKVSLDKVQRSGVRTEKIEARVLVQPTRAVGTIMHDESRLTIVTVRSDGYVEDLFVNKTGEHVHKGQPLFRLYSAEIQRAQIDLVIGGGAEGPAQRLRNLGVPESRIKEVRETRGNPRTLDWPSPATGDVIEKRIINGQMVKAGDVLYRIADHTRLWVMADVAESDLPMLKVGTRATVSVRAYMAQPIEGEVTLIYPELKAETRTARVRIKVPNPDGRLKVDMYADVVFHSGSDGSPVVSIPTSALIDSGSRQTVLVAKGEGRFEPRAVKVGRRGDGYLEVKDGVTEGEEVVTSATFLIDAESDLRAALQSFTKQDAPK